MKKNIVLLAGVSVLLSTSVLARDLSFTDRVNAQEAIERVYYSHQIGTTDPFDRAVPHAVIEKKVRTYLEESAALASLEGAPVTAEMLQAELWRMARATRMPDRLREIFEALGNDPFVIQECLVRPIVVDRTARRLRSERRSVAEWDAWRSSVADGFDETAITTIASEDVELPAPGFSLVDRGMSVPDSLGDTILDGAPEARWTHTAVWTGSLMIVWGGSNLTTLDTGGRYDPATDVWTPTSTVGAPERRAGHSALWTGTRMIVWGGGNNDLPYPEWYRNTGALYDPVADTWTPTSVVDAPSPRSAHSAVWTGNQMIVWGGYGELGGRTDGARYRPSTDTWTPISSVNAPSRRNWHSALWTGKVLIVWGGLDDNGHLDTGARYDPDTDTWTPTSTIGAPEPRYHHSAVWVGKLMVIWGGSAFTYPYARNTGGRYDPETDTWTPTSTLDAPTARISHLAVVTDRHQMIVWSGRNDDWKNFQTGGRYDPVADRWKGTTRRDVPEGRVDFTFVWTGSSAIAWGGANQNDALRLLNTGGSYDPATNRWTPTAVLTEEGGE